jgi:hypothetical protein
MSRLFLLCVLSVKLLLHASCTCPHTCPRALTPDPARLQVPLSASGLLYMSLLIATVCTGLKTLLFSRYELFSYTSPEPCSNLIVLRMFFFLLSFHCTVQYILLPDLQCSASIALHLCNPLLYDLQQPPWEDCLSPDCRCWAWKRQRIRLSKTSSATRFQPAS